MGELCDLSKVESRTATFDRMGGTKNSVNGFGIYLLNIKVEQSTFHVV